MHSASRQNTKPHAQKNCITCALDVQRCEASEADARGSRGRIIEGRAHQRRLAEHHVAWSGPPISHSALVHTQYARRRALALVAMPVSPLMFETTIACCGAPLALIRGRQGADKADKDADPPMVMAAVLSAVLPLRLRGPQGDHRRYPSSRRRSHRTAVPSKRAT